LRWAIQGHFRHSQAPPPGLLLGDHLNPVSLRSLGKQLLRLRHKCLGKRAFRMGVSTSFIIEGVEDSIDSRLTFLLQRVPLQRSWLFLGHPIPFPVAFNSTRNANFAICTGQTCLSTIC
jgi:hypothetical protein